MYKDYKRNSKMKTFLQVHKNPYFIFRNKIMLDNPITKSQRKCIQFYTFNTEEI